MLSEKEREEEEELRESSSHHSFKSDSKIDVYKAFNISEKIKNIKPNEHSRNQ